MTYDVELAERVRELHRNEEGVIEKPMFGGLAFLVDGHLAVSASSQGGLLVRIDPAETESLAGEPHVSRFRMRGRDMDGWLHVESEAVKTDAQLRRWVSRGIEYARALPPK
jgi:hypothetical protein